MPNRILAAAVAATALLALPGGALAKSADRNHDGLPDSWEQRHHLSLKVNEATVDTDHDGLNNRGEYRQKTDPRRADTDRDGLKDGAEVRTGNDPRRRDTDGDGTPDGKENAGKVTSMTDGVLWHRLVNDRGWTNDRFADWLGTMWVRLFVKTGPAN